ncbi:unnamed protein product [Thlaspi arvense]|uniref:NYN domain-containing protein n=1 Tax=Thlaspi arvense TaxID=13288 RepID=A0AAU9SFM1_THLAR|nr:unnamed protein product [Thlaspi arvense]
MFGNTAARPEYATAKIAVWWDMKACPIPEGYDARRVRPSMEAAFKQLGYSGPVSITAYGDLKQAPEHLLRGLSSTGVAVAHTIPGLTKCWPWSLLQSGSGKAYLQLQRQEDTFLTSAVEGVNLPKRFIAKCANLNAKALMISGTIYQVKNMQRRRLIFRSLGEKGGAIESTSKRQS